MKISFLVALLFCVCSLETDGQTITPKGTCLKSGNVWYLRAFIFSNSDDIDNVYGLSETDVSKHATCDALTTSTIEGNGTDSNPFNLEIRLTSGSIVVPTADCGITVNSGIVSMRLQTRRTFTHAPPLNTMIFVNDNVCEFSCNFNTVPENLAVNAEVMVDNSVNDVAATNTNEVVTMRVFANSTNSAISASVPQAIDTGIYLELELQDSGMATGVRPYDCQVCDDIHCSGTNSHTFLGINGCETAAAYVKDFDAVTPMLHRSAAFALFRYQWPSFRTLYFKCKIDFCYDGNNDKCNDPCVPSSTRRRRDISNADSALVDQSEPEKYVYAALTFPGSHATAQQRVDANQFTGEPVINTQWGLLAAVITLASLLLLGTLISGIFFCKMTRNRREDNGKL